MKFCKRYAKINIDGQKRLKNTNPLLTVIKILSEVRNLKEATYTNFEELPLFLNAETLAKLLGVSVSSSYELMHEKDFPAIRIGSRLVVPKEKLQLWIDAKTGK